MKTYRVELEGVFFRHASDPDQLFGFATVIFMWALDPMDARRKSVRDFLRVANEKGVAPTKGRYIRSMVLIEKVSEEQGPSNLDERAQGLAFYRIGFFSALSILFEAYLLKRRHVQVVGAAETGKHGSE